MWPHVELTWTWQPSLLFLDLDASTIPKLTGCLSAACSSCHSLRSRHGVGAAVHGLARAEGKGSCGPPSGQLMHFKARTPSRLSLQKEETLAPFALKCSNSRA